MSVISVPAADPAAIPDEQPSEAERETAFLAWRPSRETKRALVALHRVDTARAACTIASQWVVIVAAIAVAEVTATWWAIAAAIVVIAGRQHALGVLVHEGVHRRLARSRRANAWMSDLLCAFPLGMTTRGYGGEHLEHHRHPNTDADPYWNMFEADEDGWRWPRRWSGALRIFALDVLGLNAVRNARMLLRWGILRGAVGRPAASRGEVAGFVAFWMLAAGAVLATGNMAELALYWFVPMAGPLMMFVRLRVSAEHLMPGSVDPRCRNNVNHVDGSRLERALVAPLHINHHVVHHLYPGIPWHRLPEAHRLLMCDPAFRAWSRRYPSYLGPRGIYLRTLLRRADGRRRA